MIHCKCGCGTMIESVDSRGRERTYIFGHGNRGRKFPGLKHGKQFKQGQAPWNKGIHVENAGTYKKGHLGMQGEDNPNWRGGFVMKNGYQMRRVAGRRIYLHRLVMEQKIGRRLLPSEHVHHLDHDKTNNHPDNLRIISPVEHGRYHALTMWAQPRGGV